MSSLLVSIPLLPIPAGTIGPYVSPFLPVGTTGYVVNFLNDASWPASGDVCKFTIEQSNDSGATWAFDASLTLAGGQWKTKQGVVINNAEWSVQFNNAGSATRKIRITLNVLQPCTLGASLSSL